MEKFLNLEYKKAKEYLESEYPLLSEKLKSDKNFDQICYIMLDYNKSKGIVSNIDQNYKLN